MHLLKTKKVAHLSQSEEREEKTQKWQQREEACILCSEQGHFINDLPKYQAMGHAVGTDNGKNCTFWYTDNNPA
ncbi:hypothetical protein C0993_007865, partial [Termitomyces sp. T159_Od127]